MIDSDPPELDSRGQLDTPAVSASVAISLLVSAVRGFALGASFLCRAGKKIDDQMGRIVEARSLKTEGKSQALSLIGSGAILISAFAPISNVPIVGAVTYFNGNSEVSLVACNR
jgi:hypothetical protein